MNTVGKKSFLFLVHAFLFSLIMQVLSRHFGIVKAPEDQNHEYSDFKTMITTHKEMYVDKTLFIKEVMSCSDKVILITRPSQFGKTLALSTLDYFFSDKTEGTAQLFSGLNIMKIESDLDRLRKTHMGKHTVVRLDFSGIMHDSFQLSFNHIQERISRALAVYLASQHGSEPPNLNSLHTAILNRAADKNMTASAIKLLCESIQERTNNTSQIVLIIDNYDMPIVTSYLRDHSKDMLEFMKPFLSDTLVNRHVVKIIMTGRTAFAGDILPDNVGKYTIFDDKFSQFFGFTLSDVQELARKTAKSAEMEKMESMFYGYNFGRSALFNPGSIRRYLFEDKSDGWLDITSRKLLQLLLVRYGLYPVLTFQQLLAGENVTKEATKDLDFPGIQKSEEVYWTYMLHEGYLTVSNTSGFKHNRNIVSLRIPTLEMRTEIAAVLDKRTNFYSMKIPNYTNFVDNLVNGNFSSVQSTISDYLQDAGLYFKQLGDDIDVAQFAKYVIQLLRGVELRYKTSMEVEIQSSWQEVSIRIRPKNNEGVPIRIVVKKTSMTRLMWQQLKKALCPFSRKLNKEQTEIVILYSKWCITSCLRRFVAHKSGKIY